MPYGPEGAGGREAAAACAIPPTSHAAVSNRKAKSFTSMAFLGVVDQLHPDNDTTHRNPRPRHSHRDRDCGFLVQPSCKSGCPGRITAISEVWGRFRPYWPTAPKCGLADHSLAMASGPFSNPSGSGSVI